MDKDASNSIAELQSLVDILKSKHYRRTAAKLGRGSSSRGSFQEKSSIDCVPIPKFEAEIKELKQELDQRDAALAERDNKYRQQAAVIEALVQRMSEMEDKRYSSRRDGRSKRRSEDVIQIQEEKKQLAKRAEYLQSQLADVRGEAQAIRSIINDIQGTGRNDGKALSKKRNNDFNMSQRSFNQSQRSFNQSQRSLNQSHRSFNQSQRSLNQSQRSLNRTSSKELNSRVALMRAHSEREVRTKQLQSLQRDLERQLEARGEDTEYHVEEINEIEAMRLYLFREEEKQQDVERRGVLTEKKSLDSNKHLSERRQALALQKTIESADLVSSLFPENFRDRVMNNNTVNNNKAASGDSVFEAPANRLKRYLGDYGSDDEEYNDEPIADLFPFCTVMYADVAGFSAWSSTRDPAQGFILLQTLYQAFDVIAKRRKVFKVETIGDSYVAVTGFPDPQPNHAIIMAKFARDIVAEMKELMSELESSLGPDTADLAIRIGLHSGPVTAGILKGDRARFQLFGDTINTANRMESTGTKNKVQISKETYDLLVEAGKAHWARPRSDAINAKSKGTLKTYWLQLYSEPELEQNAAPGGKIQEGKNSASTRKVGVNIEKQDRLIDWIVDMMGEQIIKLISQRGFGESAFEPSLKDKEGTLSLDEVAEVIHLPRLRSRSNDREFSPVSTLDSKVHCQLRKYIAMIASTYHQNPFHNFEHACHVTMAVSKFIKRIMNTTAEEANNDFYYYTYGIHSDPLTVLAILFSALVHDADHRGISNMQLGIEEPEMASLYKNKSIAELNSLNIAWKLLMTSQFSALQRVLFTTKTEMQRFRQVLINVVLATDIFDKEINDTRKKRWNRAFSESSSHDDAETNSLRATIVIEHIIQAADVSHTMQHWHIYRKWNKRLFHEMHAAFKEGRMGKDPTEFWYQGELGFFDNYIIPLAKKLKDCNVFGVSSDECLNYAVRNRAEWEVHGQELVAEMAQELQSLY